MSVLLIILCTKYVWIWFNLDIYTTPFQFSYRYLPFVLLFVFIAIFSRIRSNDLKLFLYSWTICYFILSMFLVQFQQKDNSYFSDLDACIGHGEYVNENFKCSSEEFRELSKRVIDSNKKEYKYDINGGVLSFNVNTKDNISITVPKIYYKGYVAYLNDKKLELKEGYSQFISIELPSNSEGKVCVYYRHPLWLKLLDLLCLVLVMINLVYIKLIKIKF